MAWRLVSQWNLGAWAEHQSQEQPQDHPDDDEPPRERGRSVLPEPAPHRHQKDHRPRGSAQGTAPCQQAAHRGSQVRADWHQP